MRVPDNPPSRVPQRKDLSVLGTLTSKARMIDQDANAMTDDMDVQCREKWKKMDEEGKKALTRGSNHWGSGRWTRHTSARGLNTYPILIWIRRGLLRSNAGVQEK